MQIDERTKLLAVHQISVAVPGGDRILTGKFDQNGVALFQHESRHIMPGEQFTAADIGRTADPVAEARELVENGAARVMEDFEV